MREEWVREGGRVASNKGTSPDPMVVGGVQPPPLVSLAAIELLVIIRPDRRHGFTGFDRSRHTAATKT